MSEPVVATYLAGPTAVPVPGGRARSGANMSRARAKILDGAARCLARLGSRKTTMGDVAREGGVARGTLYNHFRTKGEVFGALLAAEVERLLAEVGAAAAVANDVESLCEALALAATRVSEHPVLRALAEREPDVAVAFAVPSDAGAWGSVRRLALHRVSLAQAAGAVHPQRDVTVVVDTLLRWVVSHVLWPQPAAACAAGARQLVRGLAVSSYDVAGATMPESVTA